MDSPHLERLLESYTVESVQSEPKQTTGPEFYGRSNISRRVGLVGVGLAALFGACCICVAITMLLVRSSVIVILLGNSWEKELFTLVFYLIVTACTEATGFAHGISLRSSLASERRLRFNTNLRLFSAASGLFNPNGTLCNIVMAILLVLSYSSSLLVTLSMYIVSNDGLSLAFAVGVSTIPLLVMGLALLLQAIVAFASVRSADITTWSSSPFDITAALVHHAQILPEPGRCMHGVADEKRLGPLKPSAKQSSAWSAHKSVRKVVTTLWLLVALCIVWGLIVVYLYRHFQIGSAGTWTFLPKDQSPVIVYPVFASGVFWTWLLYYTNMAVIQGPLTLALHCSELVINVVRDEKTWRKATTKRGMTIPSHPLASVFGSPLNIALLVSKPFLHWMLGLAISLSGESDASRSSLLVMVGMWQFQIFNCSVALFIFALTLTTIAMLRPSGPQPAAYGHVQTLANLVDEWSSTMWWGHKRTGHAGTSDVQLDNVEMDAWYG